MCISRVAVAAACRGGLAVSPYARKQAAERGRGRRRARVRRWHTRAGWSPGAWSWRTRSCGRAAARRATACSPTWRTSSARFPRTRPTASSPPSTGARLPSALTLSCTRDGRPLRYRPRTWLARVVCILWYTSSTTVRRHLLGVLGQAKPLICRAPRCGPVNAHVQCCCVWRACAHGGVVLSSPRPRARC